MHDASEVPQTPGWFANQVFSLFTMYPSATVTKATAVVWWSKMFHLPQGAILHGFKTAPMLAEEKQFCPSAAFVIECSKAWREPTPRGDLTLRALPEPAPEISAYLRGEFEEINKQVLDGTIDGRKAGAAYLRAIARGLE